MAKKWGLPVQTKDHWVPSEGMKGEREKWKSGKVTRWWKTVVSNVEQCRVGPPNGDDHLLVRVLLGEEG